MKYLKLLILAGLLLVVALPTLAQDTLPPLAAVQNDNVWLLDPSGEPQQITDGSAVFYSNLVWSSDGNYLAFIQRDQDFNANLMLYDRANDTLTQVDPDVADGFPVRFSFDSSQLFYVKDNPENGASQEFTMDFYSYPLGAGGEPTLAGSFIMHLGCGGGSPFPADARYTTETEGFAGFHLVLEVTPFGLVHSMDCGGGQTGLLNLETGEDISLGQISRVAVSADGTKIAGITDIAGSSSNEPLLVVDLETRETTQLETPGSPDQVVWSAQGSNTLFYSTRQQTDRSIEVTAEEQQRINTVLGTEYIPYLWEANIHRFDLDANTDTELYRTSAWAIGRMIAASDNETLYFSQIPNQVEWFRAIAEGRLDMTDPEVFENSASLVQVELYSLPTAGGEATLLGTDLNQVALKPVAVSG